MTSRSSIPSSSSPTCCPPLPTRRPLAGVMVLPRRGTRPDREKGAVTYWNGLVPMAGRRDDRVVVLHRVQARVEVGSVDDAVAHLDVHHLRHLVELEAFEAQRRDAVVPGRGKGALG